jgi:hypothetical protein
MTQPDSRSLELFFIGGHRDGSKIYKEWVPKRLNAPTGANNEPA